MPRAKQFSKSHTVSKNDGARVWTQVYYFRAMLSTDKPLGILIRAFVLKNQCIENSSSPANSWLCSLGLTFSDVRMTQDRSALL